MRYLLTAVRLAFFAATLAGLCSGTQIVSIGTEPTVSLVDSPGWFQMGNSATWSSTPAPPQNGGDTPTAFTGVFEFNQFFTSPAGYYTIDEVNTDNLQQFPIDYIAFGNGAGGGVLEFYSPAFSSFPPTPDPLAGADPQANDLGVICYGTPDSFSPSCPQSFDIDTTTSATISITAFDNFGVDPYVAMGGVIATPEPGLLWPVSAIATLMTALLPLRRRNASA